MDNGVEKVVIAGACVGALLPLKSAPGDNMASGNPQCYVSRPDNPSFGTSDVLPLPELSRRHPQSAPNPWMPLREISGARLDSQVVTRHVLSPCMFSSVDLVHTQDYLYQLAESMRTLAPASYDAHLFTLEVHHCTPRSPWTLTSWYHRTRSDNSTRNAERVRCAIDE